MWSCAASNCRLAEVQELLYRLGRAYPAGWDDSGLPLHCLAECRFLDAQGQVLVESDTRDREPFIQHVQARRAPRVAAHWAWLLRPLVPDHGDQSGALRYRQVEYYRMPVMAHLALDDPRALSRADFVRLGLDLRRRRRQPALRRGASSGTSRRATAGTVSGARRARRPTPGT